MRTLWTKDDAAAFDRRAEACGLDGRLLMETAGGQAAQLVIRHFPDRLGRVVVVGGGGNNGGDAWVIARHLSAASVPVCAVIAGDPARITGAARANLELLDHTSVVKMEAKNAERVAKTLGEATVIVDGLFGVGLSRGLEGDFAALVERINAQKAPVVALDVPSGVDADTGQILGCAVQAKLTITFGCEKVGLHQFPAVPYVGGVRRVELGFPDEAGALAVLEGRDLFRWLGQRDAGRHKNSSGALAVAAGSAGKAGAAYMAGSAAMRAGAGVATIFTRKESWEALQSRAAELMTQAFGDDPREAAVSLMQTPRLRCAVVGPGLGRDAYGSRLCRTLARDLEVTCVLDADALQVLPGLVADGTAMRGPRILTPHPGEAGHLLDCTAVEVQQKRLEAAQAIARRYRAVTILKGARSIIASPEGEVRVCPFDHPAMATAGMGDVLAGIVGALALDLEPMQAASAAVLWHMLAGIRAAKSDRGLLALDVAAALPQTLEAVRQKFGSGAGQESEGRSGRWVNAGNGGAYAPSCGGESGAGALRQEVGPEGVTSAGRWGRQTSRTERTPSDQPMRSSHGISSAFIDDSAFVSDEEPLVDEEVGLLPGKRPHAY